MTASQQLFTSATIGDFTVKNRIALAPMTRARAGASRIPNELMAEYYAQRASAGLIITEATAISEQSLGWNDSPGIMTAEQVTGWQLTTSRLKQLGTPAFLQLWHCGRASHSSFRQDRSLPVAPSAIAIAGDSIHTPEGKQPYEVPRALETSDLPHVVADYRHAATLAKEAGFDGVEVHSANGYLLDTFLQSKTNHRTDQYGGSIENRFRLLREVVEAVCQVFRSNRVAVRFSPNGVFNDMGSPDFRAQFLYAAKELAKYNLAYLHVMDGLAFGFHGLGEPMTLAEFKAVYPGNLIANCGYTHESAEAAIASGVATMVAFGRPYISNPDLPERFRNGWPLAGDAPMSSWYVPGAAGYTDFPTHGNA